MRTAMFTLIFLCLNTTTILINAVTHSKSLAVEWERFFDIGFISFEEQASAALLIISVLYCMYKDLRERREQVEK